MSTATQSHNTFNAQNEITGMTGFTTPTYDNNGNMKRDEGGITYTYDAWNRMVAASASAEVFTYDADNRRPGLSICGGAVTNSYYSTDWQVLEDDIVNGSTTTKDTYVWSQSYIDDMVARDQSVNGGAATRIYAQQDANHDVTSITDASGNVLERFVYDPYGTATVLNATTWASRADGYSWIYRFQGGRYDPASGKINFRNRDLDTVTGTWMEQDPAGYVDGASLYQAFTSDPISGVDPSGTDFIALNSHGVSGMNSFPLAHYSLEYWSTKCDPPLLQELGSSWEENNAPPARFLHSIELEPDDKWVLRWTTRMLETGPDTRRPPKYVTRSHSAPIILSGIDADQSKHLYDFAALFEGDASSVGAKWRTVTNVGYAYPYAEPLPLDRLSPAFKRHYTPQRWPNSEYLVFGNNSNTFIRYIIANSGLPAIELSGIHPGNMSPVPNTRWAASPVPTYGG
jgi:RHS repeat-associated protein